MTLSTKNKYLNNNKKIFTELAKSVILLYEYLTYHNIFIVNVCCAYWMYTIQDF